MSITEKLMHFIWQHRKFDIQNITSEDNLKIEVNQIGYLNTNAGPDFLEAKLTINQIKWAGSVEMHIKSSDWTVHNHQLDAAYNNVILHVVWENDTDIVTQSGQSPPTLVLKKWVNPTLISKYEALMHNFESIPCESQLAQIDLFTKIQAVEKAAINRLERKAKWILEVLENNQLDWEQTTFQCLAKAFGFKVNSDAMEHLAKSLPLKVIQKHADNVFQVEALLFGMAGLLQNSDDLYAQKLKAEFLFLQKKYSLPSPLANNQWKFLRLRPANFPTVRIAQLTQLLAKTKSYFSYYVLSEDIESLKNAFDISPSEYWQNHYHFGKTTSIKNKKLGKNSVENLLINTISPILIAYAQFTDNEKYVEKATQVLEKLKAEKNNITEFFNQFSFENKDALQSQGLIELKNEYCQNKQCLNCHIGAKILYQT